MTTPGETPTTGAVEEDDRCTDCGFLSCLCFDDDGDGCYECYECGGEGFVSDCFDGFCVNADYGCDLCTRRCPLCRDAHLSTASGQEGETG